MSDSDDTDVLLLIPPDFFLLNNSLNSSPDNNSKRDFNRANHICNSFICNFCEMAGIDYHYLPPRHQLELENIDAKLSQIEKNFSICSDVSAVSNDVQSLDLKDRNNQNQRSPLKIAALPTNNLFHSTPKFERINKDIIVSEAFNDQEMRTDNIINEIDRFLKKNENFNQIETNLNPKIQVSSWNNFPATAYLPSTETLQNTPEIRRMDNNDQELISLSEIWNGEGCSNKNVTLQEERLRRQHCERIIEALQSKLLEYQQRISVAIQVDKMKDVAIDKHQEENRRFKNQVDELNDKLINIEKNQHTLHEKMQLENEEFKSQKESLEKKLSQALNLVTELQNKNDILEMKVENLTKASTEIGSIYKKQIEQIELRLSNSQKSEAIANGELNKLKIQFDNLQKKNEVLLTENTDFQKNLDNHRRQLEQIKKEKNKLYELEKKNKELEESYSEISKKEKCFVKELENQRISLKAYYQQQVEKVVAEKLKEFQTQLDSVEESLKSEAKERERIIAERAIKQVEMINEKSEQEISLLNEKHREEVELYRIQLANCSKKIQDLENKLEEYKSRRADIAEKLHNIMETQWKKALEILTSPNGNINNDFSTINPHNIDQEKFDGFRKIKDKTSMNNEYFETPVTSRNRRSNDLKNIDRLQAFIEMLLDKSPNDLDKLEEVLAMPNRKSEIKHKGLSTEVKSKPPWK